MGSVGSGNNTITPQQEKALNKIANKTRNLKNEQYRIVDQEGNVLLSKQGKEHEVSATVGEKRQFMDGNISIHNHPAGGTFSSADFTDFGHGATEIWAAAPEGTYKLINTRVGKDDQFSGWTRMRDAYNRDIDHDMSYLTLRDKANEAPHIKALRDEMSSVSKKWVEARDSGASQSVLDGYIKRFDELENQLRPAVKAEIRRLEVEPNHEWLKKNASKYGFKYVFEERKKRR